MLVKKNKKPAKKNIFQKLGNNLFQIVALPFILFVLFLLTPFLILFDPPNPKNPLDYYAGEIKKVQKN